MQRGLSGRQFFTHCRPQLASLFAPFAVKRKTLTAKSAKADRKRAQSRPCLWLSQTISETETTSRAELKCSLGSVLLREVEADITGEADGLAVDGCGAELPTPRRFFRRAPQHFGAVRALHFGHRALLIYC